MTSEEIQDRNTDTWISECFSDEQHDSPHWMARAQLENISDWLQEIAYQLARMNERNAEEDSEAVNRMLHKVGLPQRQQSADPATEAISQPKCDPSDNLLQEFPMVNQTWGSPDQTHPADCSCPTCNFYRVL